MSPDEALEYGLIDHVITGHRGHEQVTSDSGTDPGRAEAPTVPADKKSSPAG